MADTLSGAEAQQRERLHQAVAGGGSAGATGPAVGFALLAAVTLDGVPENVALGVALLGETEADAAGSSLALLVAIFASNLPEALVGAVAMRAAGRSPRFAITIWALTPVRDHHLGAHPGSRSPSGRSRRCC